ncbi:MAG: hypothetical protein LBL91_06335 [Lachnospiraceae bacterium]|jgi:hypothetical protein|nr:hypothetical protein [Lachnospiraceae bacterium]
MENLEVIYLTDEGNTSFNINLQDFKATLLVGKSETRKLSELVEIVKNKRNQTMELIGGVC